MVILKLKVHLDCIPCFQRQALRAARFVTNDEKVQQEILETVMKRLLDIDWTSSPPVLARIAHSVVRELTGELDPYKDVKKLFNKKILDNYSSYSEIVDESKDPLFTAIKLAIAGNIIDYGPDDGFNVDYTVNKVLKDPLGINDYDNFKELLQSATSMAYVADNTGEIVFDKLLLENITKKYPKLKKITFIVKGGPSINDATIEDAMDIGLDKISNIEFDKSGIGLPNTGFERWSPEFQNMLKQHDIVISKGQGNYEAMSDLVDYRTFFLLMAKCPVVASDLKVDIKKTILKNFPERK